MESFRFHMTLSGPIRINDAALCSKHIENHFAGALTEPVLLDTLTIVGERLAGNFYELTRHPLG